MERKQIISIFLAVIMVGSIFAYALSSLYDKKDQPEETLEDFTIPENITPELIYLQYSLLNDTERAWAEVYMNATYNGVEVNSTEYPVPSEKAAYFYVLYISYLQQEYEKAISNMNSTNETM